MPAHVIGTSIDKLIGSRIRTRRRELGLNHADMADRLGITREKLHKIEEGQNHVTVASLHRWSQMLGRPLTWFFQDLEIGGDQ